MAFSGAIKLGDLNDFIAPSQACVVNLKGQETAKIQAAPAEDAVQLQSRAPPSRPTGFQQTQVVSGSDAVKVTLNDCLACSGCVTSAETVLLEHQSIEELQVALADPQKTVIVSVSPQSRASLAALHNVSPAETFRRLTRFLKGLGVRQVYDTSCSRDLALLEAAQEFCARYLAAHPQLATQQAQAASVTAQSGVQQPPAAEQQVAGLPGPQPGSASYGEQAAGAAQQQSLEPYQAPEHPLQQQSKDKGARQPAGHGAQLPDIANGWHQAPAPPPAASWQQPFPRRTGGPSEPGQEGGQGPSLPMLASACPGWVCYAEKTHGDYVLPYISTTKSPQAVMGTIVKRHICSQLGLSPSQVYHCAIMPCYDKKLEAARDDFKLTETNTPETDSVLTSGELQQLLQQRGILDLKDVSEAPLDSLLSSVDEQGKLYGVPGGSGGYLEFIFRTAARQLFGRDLPHGPLAMKQLRNADFQEVSLEVEGKPVLRFAAAYGFRNIQTLMRKIKRRACEYHFVEVMACPSGCLNGGGQVKAGQGQTSKQLLDELDSKYHHQGVIARHPADNPVVPLLYGQWVHGTVHSPAAQALLHTVYHRRERTVSSTVGDW